MTVRMAELMMAIILAIGSIGIMWSARELNIGWVPEKGPGSGVWPFWLSFGMLLCCIYNIYRWFKGLTPESQSREAYIPRDALMLVGAAFGALVFLLLGIHWIGIYFSLIVFMLFFLKVMGGHGWLLTIAISLIMPVIVFAFFEWALVIPLPKGISEPLFYPIYDLIY